MLFRGCTIDKIAYNGLIKVFCNAGNDEKGLELYEQMIMNGLSADTISCNILNNGVGKVGKVDNTFEFPRDD